jgi:hypothetical protein
MRSEPVRLVVMAASAGGIPALSRILVALPLVRLAGRPMNNQPTITAGGPGGEA